ncbi:MAG: STAS/SEC14 domain-containing protein [Micavibrio sp.]
MSATVELLPETSGSVICLRLTGTITAHDFVEYWEKPLKAIVEKYGYFNLYAYYDANFVTWGEEAADLNFKYFTALGPKCRRFAYVNPPQSRFLMMKLMSPILNAEVRYFNEGEQAQALAWVRETA